MKKLKNMRKKTDKLISQINSEEENTANSDVFIDNYAALFLMQSEEN